jgi:FAD/FMN-containing dehydrogenase
VITEVTVRLRGRPDSDLSLALPLPSSGADVAALLTMLRQTTYATLAAELLSPAVAATIGVGATACILVRVAGNQTQVAAQRAAFAALGDCIALDSATVWARLRANEPAGSAVFRVSAPPSDLAATWEEVVTNDTVWCHASLERGIVRCVSAEHDDDLTQRIRRLATTRRVIIESAPAAVWNARGAAPPASLDDGMRRAFDPGGVLNPGILGGSR